MRSHLQAWWQKIKPHGKNISITLFILIAIIVLTIIIRWNWTAFNSSSKTTTTNTIHGTTITTEQPQQRALWDWLQLLIIPAILAIAGFAFTLTTSRNERRATEQRSKDEQKAAEQRNKTERDIALNNQREATLQDYIDKMSELLLEKKLRESQPKDEIRNIARVRTLTVLSRLDSNRKKSVLQFLHESGLINKNKCIINLDGANLTSANLSEANLNSANLSGANLTSANLSEANLR